MAQASEMSGAKMTGSALALAGTQPLSPLLIRDGFVTAAASLNYDPMVALVAEVLYSGRRISKLEAE